MPGCPGLELPRFVEVVLENGSKILVALFCLPYLNPEKAQVAFEAGSANMMNLDVSAWPAVARVAATIKAASAAGSAMNVNLRAGSALATVSNSGFKLVGALKGAWSSRHGAIAAAIEATTPARSALATDGSTKGLNFASKATSAAGSAIPMNIYVGSVWNMEHGVAEQGVLEGMLDREPEDGVPVYEGAVIPKWFALFLIGILLSSIWVPIFLRLLELLSKYIIFPNLFGRNH